MPEEDHYEYYEVKYECVHALVLIHEMFRRARDSNCLHVVWELLSAGIRGPDLDLKPMQTTLKTTFTAPLRRVLLGPVSWLGRGAEVSPVAVREAHDRLMKVYDRLSPGSHFESHMRVAIRRLRHTIPTRIR